LGGDLRLSDGRAPREDGGDGAGGGVGEAVSSGEALRLGPGDKSGSVNNKKYNETNRASVSSADIFVRTVWPALPRSRPLSFLLSRTA
jgi:hypothetical protein